MDPMTIAALIQAGVGLVGGIQKGVASAKQNKMAKEYGKKARPDYQIPPSLLKATDMSRANLNPPVNTQLLQEIGANGANTISRAAKVGTSTGDMLAAAGNINAQENAAKRAMFADNQGRKDAMLGQYMQMLQTMGGQENKAWEWNKAQPYINAQEAAQALHQSSAQNAAGAIGDLAGGISAGANSLMQGKQMDMQGDMNKQLMDLLLGKNTDATIGGAASPLSDAQKLQSETQSGNLIVGQKPSVLTNQVLKMWNKNTDANTPVAQQIATNPTTPVIKTDATGKIFENGKRLDRLPYQYAPLEERKKQILRNSQDKSNYNNMYKTLISNPELSKMFIK